MKSTCKLMAYLFLLPAGLINSLNSVEAQDVSFVKKYVESHGGCGNSDSMIAFQHGSEDADNLFGKPAAEWSDGDLKTLRYAMRDCIPNPSFSDGYQELGIVNKIKRILDSTNRSLPCGDSRVVADVTDIGKAELERLSRISQRSKYMPIDPNRFNLEFSDERSVGNGCAARLTLHLMDDTAAAFMEIRYQSTQSGGGWYASTNDMPRLITALNGVLLQREDKERRNQADQNTKNEIAEMSRESPGACPEWTKSPPTPMFFTQVGSIPLESYKNDKKGVSSQIMSLLVGDRGAVPGGAIDRVAQSMSRQNIDHCLPTVASLIRNAEEGIDNIRKSDEAAATPKGQLLSAYRNYVVVKKCYESRVDYEQRYVQEGESSEAKNQIKSIESHLISQDETLDKNKVWDEANDAASSEIGAQNGSLSDMDESKLFICRTALEGLKQKYLGFDAEAGKVKKDF